MRVDAQLGGYDAAFYPALELAAKGFQPLAMTDCLNFGNPEKTEIMSEFVASVEALAHASRLMNAPVISGNVSFYNETLNRNITSTPATGLVGLRESLENLPRSTFANEGDEVVLWRLPGVRFVTDQHGGEAGFSGALDPEAVTRWLMEVFQMGMSEKVAATRVVGKFGLHYALYRMCSEELGAVVGSGAWAEGPGAWSEERLYEVLLSGPAGLFEGVKTRAERSASQAWKIGTVSKGVLSVAQEQKDLKGLHGLYKSGWSKQFPRLS